MSNLSETNVGIYRIVSPSGRIYVGQSSHLINRIWRYKNNRCKKQIRLYASLIKYGFENHIFEVLEYCEKADLNEKERYWQEFYNVTSKKGLNCDLVNSKNAPKERSAETKSKISKSLIGHTRNLGRKHTGQALINIGNVGRARKGTFHTPEARLKIKVARAKQTFSDETRKLLSENSGMKRTVLDLNTGIFWSSVKEVSLVYGIKQNTLITRLNGYRKNKTQFTYI